MKSHVTLLACTIGSGEEKKYQRGRVLPSDLAIRNQSSGDARDGRIASRLPLKADAWLAGALGAAPSSDAGDLAALRVAGADALSELRFPGRKEEAWRRTDLSWLKGANIVAPATEAGVASSLVEGSVDESAVGMCLVLVDGVVDAALSDLSALPEGITVGGLSSSSGSVAAATATEAAQQLPEAGAADARWHSARTLCARTPRADARSAIERLGFFVFASICLV